MEAEAVFAQRAGESSRIRLAIYMDILKRIAALIDNDKFDDVLSLRNELTVWSPKMVEFPVWQTIYKLRSSAQTGADLSIELRDSIRAINAVLERSATSVPTDMIGDISGDVTNYLKATV